MMIYFGFGVSLKYETIYISSTKTFSSWGSILQSELFGELNDVTSRFSIGNVVAVLIVIATTLNQQETCTRQKLEGFGSLEIKGKLDQLFTADINLTAPTE